MHTNLNDSHIETRLVGQLLADVARWLGRGSEGRLQCFQLLGLDGGAWSTTLGAARLIVITITVATVGRGIRMVLRW